MSSLKPASQTQNPFESLPDELLLFIFKHLNSFQRALILSTCRNWNHFILINTQFWNTLTIPHGLSLHLVLIILKVFNSRSNFKLKQVVIETFIDSHENLDLILEELKKSAGTLKLLVLRQNNKLNRPTRKFTMQSFPMLEALFTLGDLQVLHKLTLYLPILRGRYAIGVAISDKVNMKVYTTATLFDIDEEDLEWLSNVVYLDPGWTESAMSLYKVLQATSQLLELDLYWYRWWKEEQIYDDWVPDVPSSLEKLYLENLRELNLPFRSYSLSVFKQLVKIDGDRTLIAGTMHSLISFEVDSLKALSILLYEDEAIVKIGPAETMKVIEHLFQQKAMVEILTLDCPAASKCPTGGQLQLNQLLEILSISVHFKKGGKSENVEEFGKDSSGAVENLILPRLVKLVIKDPVKLDRNLLRQVIKGRSDRNSSFKFEFIEGPYEDVLSIDDWEARGLL